MLHFSNTLLLAATCLLVNAGVLSETVTTCEGVHRLTCDIGVISVQTALYGRADSETCSEGKPPQETSNTKCSLADAVDILKRRCDGKTACELSTNVVGVSDPCHGTHKYLQTKYTCLPAIHHVTCEHSYAELYCDEGQVIFVYSADYGRHDKTTCSYKRPASQLENIDCSQATSKLNDSCSGKNSCIIKASNSVFGDPCVGTYKYLEVAYICEYELQPQDSRPESEEEHAEHQETYETDELQPQDSRPESEEEYAEHLETYETDELQPQDSRPESEEEYAEHQETYETDPVTTLEESVDTQ